MKRCLTVDPTKRFDAAQVMGHKWIGNNNTNALNLDQLRKYNATRKLKKAANKLIMAQRAMSLAKVTGK